MKAVCTILALLAFLAVAGATILDCEALVVGEARDIGKLSPEEKQRLQHDAFKEYAKINEFLNEGGDREEAAARCIALADKYQGTDYSNSASELSILLRAMAEEDKDFREPEDVTKLSEQEKIDCFIFKLRDLAEHKNEYPAIHE